MGKLSRGDTTACVPYLLERTPRRLLNFSTLWVRCLFEGLAYSVAAIIIIFLLNVALIWGWRLFEVGAFSSKYGIGKVRLYV